MNTKKMISGFSALMMTVTMLASCSAKAPENTVHTIDKCNEDDLFRKLNLVRVNKITFELNDFKGIDSNLRRLIVGICV